MKRKNLMYLTVLCVLTFALTACGNNKTEDAVSTEVMTESVQESAGQSEETATEEASTEMSTETAESEETSSVIEPEEVPATEQVPEPAAVTETVTETSPKTEAVSETYTFGWSDSIGTAIGTVNIYDIPSENGNIIGTFTDGETVFCSKRCIENGWYTVEADDYINEYGNLISIDGYIKGTDVINPVGDERFATTEPFGTTTFTRNADGSVTVEYNEFSN